MSVLHLSVLWYILAIEKKPNHQHPRRERGVGKVFSVASPAARNALMSKEQAMPSLGVFFPGLLVLSGAL